jgi:ferredoxin
MSRPHWFVQLIKWAFPGRFLAARLTNLPVVGSIAEHLLFQGDGLIYLPHDRVIPVNESVDLPGEIVLPSQIVDHFIRAARTHWIMNTCICREGNHCREYPIEWGCIFLGEAAAGINPKLGRRVTMEEALAHAQRCREAGLVHLIGRNKMDTVWLGVGPGDRLMTICNCCPCCCLMGVLPYLAPQISAKITRMPGVSVAVNGNCVGCGTCTDGICFVKAINLVDGHAFIDDECRGCGLCVSACPQQAIEISVDHGQFVAEAIARLSPLVDVT